MPRLLRINRIGTMKVIVEIQSKYVEIAKGIMLGACTDEESEKNVTEIAEQVKQSEEPIAINLQDLYDGSSSADAANMSQMNIALSSFAMYAKMKEAGE